MGKLFGTDGIRGVANRDLTPELAFRIGRITAWVLGREAEEPLFLIGRDTRLSGTMLEGALTAGIASVGGTVGLLGIASTPAVAFMSRNLGAVAGIVVSASHNPIEDNGLKVFEHRGYKLPDRVEAEIENIYFSKDDRLPRPEGTGLGRAYNAEKALDFYLEHLAASAPPLDGFKLVVDCAHGAACRMAGGLFSRLGATVEMIHDQPDGTLINVNCGATDTSDLQKTVTENQAHIGLAFDGDADRLIAVDEQGKVVDGDAIMAVCALSLAEKGRLKHNTLVTTVMSNGGLEILAGQRGMEIVRTAVGDRYVLERMLEGGYNFGGEQSGHVIFSDWATTGDGILTALQLLAVVREKELPLSELAAVLERLPQVLVNRKVNKKTDWMDNPRIRTAVERVKKELGTHSRVLVRPSGTEPKIRVMIEAPQPEDELEKYARSLADLIAREMT